MLTPTVATLLNRVAGRFGCELTPKGIPIVIGSPLIVGSYPPITEYYDVGSQDDYFIHAGYQPRLDNAFHNAFRNDNRFEDEWQAEVYKFASEVAEREQLTYICDIGCGSGFKLIKFFGHKQTLGLDLEPTIRRLKEKYPDHNWMVSDFLAPPPFSCDLVICSDVIEHLGDPNQLLAFIKSLAPRYIVFSTPERNLLRVGTHNGPPKNPAHVREWSMPEFRAYIESTFEILDHFVSSTLQCTQCVLARPCPTGTRS